MPKVSIIVPNYNHERFLAQRIQSILNQSYQNFELLYLDDASTDNSNAVFAQFADSARIRATFNPTNSGSPFKQWNKGIRQAKGEYIWIAESDDYADQTLLEKLVSKLDEYPNVGVAYCQSWQIDELGLLQSTLHFHTDSLDRERWKYDFVNAGRDECSNYLICKNTIPNASGVLFRRALYEEVGGAAENMRLCGDWLLWVKMLLRSDVAFVAEPLNYFRSHSHTSRSKLTKLGYELHESLEIVRLISQNTVPSEAAWARGIDEAFDRWSSCLFVGDSSLKNDLITFKQLAQVEGSLQQKLALYQRALQMMTIGLRFRLKLGTKLKRMLQLSG